MADLKQICIDGFCTEITDYTAGNGITISNNKVISAIAPDLSNYYDKDEVNDLLDGLTNANIEVVSTLPATGETNVIYLVLKDPAGSEGNIYNEYVYVGDKYELIGDTEIDLSNYVTQDQLKTRLNSKQNVLTATEPLVISDDSELSMKPLFLSRTGRWNGTFKASDAVNVPINIPDGYKIISYDNISFSHGCSLMQFYQYSGGVTVTYSTQGDTIGISGRVTVACTLALKSLFG